MIMIMIILQIGMNPQLFSPPVKQEVQSNFASPLLASKGTFSSRSSLASYKPTSSANSTTAKIGSVTSSSTNIANIWTSNYIHFIYINSKTISISKDNNKFYLSCHMSVRAGLDQILGTIRRDRNIQVLAELDSLRRIALQVQDQINLLAQLWAWANSLGFWYHTTITST